MALSERAPLLILRPLGLGDLVTAIPALRALARAFPDRHRVLAAPARLAPLALHIGAVDEVVDTNPLAPLDGACVQPEVAVNLHGKGPESHGVLLAANPKRLIGFANPDVPESADGPVWRSEEHEVQRWCRMLSESGIPADSDDLDVEAPACEVPDLAVGATLIHPGAASAARRWPVERFAAVARAEQRSGRRVVITAGDDEVGLASFLAELAGLPPASVIAGTDVLELAAVVAAAGRVVCGDTSVAHLATAVRTPSVVLFGPVAPAHWGPPPDRPWHIALWKGQSGNPHGTRPDPGLLEIGVDEVLAALEALPPSAVAAGSPG